MWTRMCSCVLMKQEGTHVTVMVNLLSQNILRIGYNHNKLSKWDQTCQIKAEMMQMKGGKKLISISPQSKKVTGLVEEYWGCKFSLKRQRLQRDGAFQWLIRIWAAHIKHHRSQWALPCKFAQLCELSFNCQWEDYVRVKWTTVSLQVGLSHPSSSWSQFSCCISCDHPGKAALCHWSCCCQPVNPPLPEHIFHPENFRFQHKSPFPPSKLLMCLIHVFIKSFVLLRLHYSLQANLTCSLIIITLES